MKHMMTILNFLSMNDPGEIDEIKFFMILSFPQRKLFFRPLIFQGYFMDILSKRQNKILALAGKNGKVDVEKLSVTFVVSPQTIRKDLKTIVINEKLPRRLEETCKEHSVRIVIADMKNECLKVQP